MPILPSIGRSHPRTRLTIALIYAILLAASATMIHPFLLMLAGSTRSAADIRDMNAIPRFFFDDVRLYRKHIEALFNESLDACNMTYDTDASSFETVDPPTAVSRPFIDAWTRFLHENPPPPHASSCGHIYTPVSRTLPLERRAFRDFIRAQYGARIEDVNRALETDFAGWNSFFVLPQNFLLRFATPSDTPFTLAYNRFKDTRPRGLTYFFCAEGFYKKLYLKTQFTRDIALYNREHATAYRDYSQVRLSSAFPLDKTPAEQRDWEDFVRHTLNPLWVAADPRSAPLFREYLAARYTSIENFNRAYATDLPDFASVAFPTRPPADRLALSDWDAWIAGWPCPETGRLHIAPREALRIVSTDLLFREALRREFDGDIALLNERFETDFAAFDDIAPPQRELHYADFLERRAALRLEFATRNYRAVLDYILFHGRGILNTAIYCSLAVLLALIVNPLAAYALSRSKRLPTYRILLLLMLTMAFPPMVTQIPVFLMLRQFRLLNTFAALLLPGLANGYGIFLLKGFFDSLPRELYESAELDGAGEWTLFWTFTMRLSSPILSVIALQAFVAAYTNFMFALLICQDEGMWTLMVWLYELQQNSGQAVLYASLILAAIPTFLIFIFCQKIILRGIVIPVER